MLHFNIGISIQISNPEFTDIQGLPLIIYLLINTKSSLGKILQGKCFATPITCKIHFLFSGQSFCSDSSFVSLHPVISEKLDGVVVSCNVTLKMPKSECKSC